MGGRGSTTVAEGYAAALRPPLAQLSANLARLAAADSLDAVHEARVALRRIGAALRVYRDALPEPTLARLKAEMRWLRHGLGPIRDLDVFATETVPMLRRAVGDDPGLEAIARAAIARRAAAQPRLAEIADHVRTQAFQMEIDRWLDGEATAAGNGTAEILASPLADFAAARVRRRFKKLRQAGAELAELNESQLHEIRIRLRTFRYALDFFEPALPKKRFSALRGAVSDLQDAFGALNDAVTAAAMAAMLADSRAGNGPLARGAGIIIGWSAARRAAIRERLPDPWTAFTAAGERLARRLG
jgi:CHAD domain-containing protein